FYFYLNKNKSKLPKNFETINIKNISGKFKIVQTGSGRSTAIYEYIGETLIEKPFHWDLEEGNFYNAEIYSPEDELENQKQSNNEALLISVEGKYSLNNKNENLRNKLKYIYLYTFLVISFIGIIPTMYFLANFQIIFNIPYILFSNSNSIESNPEERFLIIVMTAMLLVSIISLISYLFLNKNIEELKNNPDKVHK
ncbi:MAG: hypothetical protein KDK36_07710, partial [Leptospiraceae bacterium]|nr:hypothetical protein [Leptospiraceae bacterium]